MIGRGEIARTAAEAALGMIEAGHPDSYYEALGLAPEGMEYAISTLAKDTTRALVGQSTAAGVYVVLGGSIQAGINLGIALGQKLAQADAAEQVEAV